MSVFQPDGEVICGERTDFRCFDKGTEREFWQAFIFYRGIRNWLIIGAGRTREEARAEAERVLSDPVRFGVALMSEATRMLELLAGIQERARQHPNRGVPYGDDLPLTPAPIQE